MSCLSCRVLFFGGGGGGGVGGGVGASPGNLLVGHIGRITAVKIKMAGQRKNDKGKISH